MAQKFTATLSVSSIRKLQNDLKKYKSDLKKKVELFAEALAEEGVEIAKIQIASYNAIFTGELLDSIHKENTNENGKIVFAVVADTLHACFVEFGTGQMGENDPYKHPFPDGVTWVYGSGEKIRQHADGTYYWFYPGKDGQWHYTEGLPARPFMYDTAMELRQKVETVAKKVFG